ncbi:sulfur carrier protein ThiS [Dyadobacter sp. CY326]|uniref:sulfur carrier protein ThiS n=1 Tax=Dyadobacter sp. CY326 TaxID=2907300 RepID=UPI001F20DC47|nr:sulfur carrier protein ThiS [Dyadobacter sp. CY326]MCE7063708.1 sulfur carrier protein ThiS [Dyadobacter sp. CY326]
MQLVLPKGKVRDTAIVSQCIFLQKGPFLKFFSKTLFRMEININGQLSEFSGPISVQELLSELFPDHAKGIAVAVNQSVVPKSAWPVHVLQPHDQVMLITATQGG